MSKRYLVDRYISPQIDKGSISCLSKELCPLTSEGFMRGCVTPELASDVDQHLQVADRIVVARDEQSKTPVAFITASMHEFQAGNEPGLMYHLEGIIVDPDCQGSGISKELLTEDVIDSKATHLGFHTQNARMRALGGKVAEINDQDSIQYANVIDTRNPQGIVDAHRYGNCCLYGNQEKFAQTAISEIDWQAGDALICIGPVRKDLLNK